MDENNAVQNNAPEKGKTIVGFVLLTDANLDWPRFRHYLKEDWGISFSDEIKDGAVVFSAEGRRCACSLLPNPVPNKEAETCARNNLLWKDAVEETAKHAAHVMVAVMDSPDPEERDELDASLLFCKIASSMLKLKNTIGIYKNPTVYEKQFYIDVAQNIKKTAIPIPIMVHIGIYMTAQRQLCGYTYGLRFFGREEVEVIDTRAQPQDLFNFLMAISDYVVTQEIDLKDGETIGFTEDEKLPIRISPAQYFPGNSIKIGFMTD
ncbi:MAG: DUF4261 domain-containing protein [Ruminococcus sp.]|nr:DUF4261 domain-containing protein [Ruminococcus sp.]